MILTIYNPDGTTTKQPIGYGGGLCHAATKPYEKYDIPGTVTKKPTPEASQPPAKAARAEEQEKQRVR